MNLKLLYDLADKMGAAGINNHVCVHQREGERESLRVSGCMCEGQWKVCECGLHVVSCLCVTAWYDHVY